MHRAAGGPNQPSRVEPAPLGAADPGAWSSDEAVLAAIGRCEEAALAALYDRYGRPAFGLAYRVLGERGVAEDVVQEAFLAVWRHADRYRPERGSPRAWLMTIVHHAAIDRRRGRHKREQTDVRLDDVEFALETGAGDPFAAVAEGIAASQVRTVLAGLPPEQREAIELAYFGGHTYRQVAVMLEAPEGTVKSRIRSGLRRLRKDLAEAGVGVTWAES